MQAEKAIEKARVLIDKTKQVMRHVEQLILNMPIHWSSTYVMLHQADQLKDVIIHSITFSVCY